MRSLESDTTERLHFHFSLSCIGEGNGNPLQCSCLENPRDGKPGGLPSIGRRVGHDWSDLAATANLLSMQLFTWVAFVVAFSGSLLNNNNNCWSQNVCSALAIGCGGRNRRVHSKRRRLLLCLTLKCQCDFYFIFSVVSELFYFALGYSQRAVLW